MRNLGMHKGEIKPIWNYSRPAQTIDDAETGEEEDSRSSTSVCNLRWADRLIILVRGDGVLAWNNQHHVTLPIKMPCKGLNHHAQAQAQHAIGGRRESYYSVASSRQQQPTTNQATMAARAAVVLSA